jgi:hypothetical protein
VCLISDFYEGIRSLGSTEWWEEIFTKFGASNSYPC